MQADAIRRGRSRQNASTASSMRESAYRADDDDSERCDTAGAAARLSAAQQQERERQQSLHKQPVVLRLLHVMKSYSIVGNDEPVHALNDVTLCERDRLSSPRNNNSHNNDNTPLGVSAECLGNSNACGSDDSDHSGSSMTKAKDAVAAARMVSDGAPAVATRDGSASSTHTAATTTSASAAACGNAGGVWCDEQCRAELNECLKQPFAPVHRGEFVMIRGPSGGGKTTLLNIIGLIDACTGGVIELDGMAITSRMRETTLADIRLRMIGFVFQTFNLIPTMTAAENVELPMTLLGKLSQRATRLRARQLLTLVGLRNRVNHLPSELSGGEQQRVTIARSLANNPSILLLDEPTGDLDTINTIEIMDLLLRINRHTHTTCIMVTHNPDVECYADRILYMSDGRFVKEVHNAQPMRLDAKRYAAYLDAEEQRMMQTAAVAAAAADSDATTHNNHSGSSDNDGDDGDDDIARLARRVNSTTATPRLLSAQSTVAHHMQETTDNTTSRNSDSSSEQLLHHMRAGDNTSATPITSRT